LRTGVAHRPGRRYAGPWGGRAVPCC
jgi:hypothetical protein